MKNLSNDTENPSWGGVGEFSLSQLVRPCVASLKPYSSARDEYKGEASVYLDANENPLSPAYNRYPDPMQWQLKEEIAKLKGVKATQILLGNGSDEPIDLLYRAFCEPRLDNVVAIDPTYGMYKVCADVNDVAYRSVRLTEDYDLQIEKLLAATDQHSKLLWLCSPNNPTANSFDAPKLERLLRSFSGIVVIDEAYIDFSSSPSWLQRLAEFPNLVVLQTFSKAWGSAAIRLGMAFASEAIIGILSKIKYPYNINQLTQEYGLKMLANASQVRLWVEELTAQRTFLMSQFEQMKGIEKVYPSDANFVLIKVQDANEVYSRLVDRGIIVRNRNKIALCDNCLRITVGSEAENQELLQALSQIINQ